LEAAMENEKTLVHVRFAPDGSVVEISKRPLALSPQEWFNRLSDKAGTHYQAFAGGRGMFRLETQEFEALHGADAS